MLALQRENGEQAASEQRLRGRGTGREGGGGGGSLCSVSRRVRLERQREREGSWYRQRREVGEEGEARGAEEVAAVAGACAGAGGVAHARCAGERRDAPAAAAAAASVVCVHMLRRASVCRTRCAASSVARARV